MKTQIELLREAVKLAENNPTARIHVCANSDELSVDFGWTAHEISHVDLDWWYADEENVIIGLEAIKECLDANKEDSEPEATDEEAMAEGHLAILIYTKAGM